MRPRRIISSAIRVILPPLVAAGSVMWLVMALSAKDACASDSCAADTPRAVASAARSARFGSGPLGRSVQNEADAAIDRAVAWLVATQSPRGYWGSTNVKTTAVCAIAVRGDRSEYTADESNCLHRALSWLRTQKETNGWSKAAISLLDGRFDGDMSGIFAEYAQCLETNDVAAAFVGDVASGSGRASGRRLAGEWESGLARKWYDDPELGWWLARSINIGLGGELAVENDDGNGESVRNLNWRGVLARKWLLSQRIDSRGGGHWDASPEKTAFAVLLLCEL